MVRVSRRSARVNRARGMTIAYRKGYRAAVQNQSIINRKIYRKGYQAGYIKGWHDSDQYKYDREKYPIYKNRFNIKPWGYHDEYR